MEDVSRSIDMHHHRRQGRGGGGGGTVAAPFVLKTYLMVDDPSTDAIIAWGGGDNSFVILDPFAFSQSLLPSHFKHSNFSSFVRQLNTYGFRKVEPHRWEFAHASFLRGQTHLLRQIVRRNSGCGKKKNKEGGEGEVEDEEEAEEERVAAEVVRLKQEQRRIEERVQGMWQRVQETERRPRQMLAFLVKVAGDPNPLDRLGGPGVADAIEGGEKRARLQSGADERMLEMGGGGGSWQLGGEWMAVEDGEEGMLCSGGEHELLGTMDGVESVGGEYGGGVEVDVDVGGGPTPCDFSFHVDSGF